LGRVELRGVSKVYPGGIEAIRPLDLTVEDGALFVVVGPSGSGKSTLLRLIAGLEPPSAGSLWIDGRRVDGLAPRDRDLAMVFQSPVVYPYLSVFENLAFGLRARASARGAGGADVARSVSEMARLLGVSELLGRRPGTLSGGQRQRVALGRALVRRPRIFLLDEPFSSLDPPLRAALRAELSDLHRRLGTTMIHVTHDQAEALALGTSIGVLNEGRIVHLGAPLDVYEHPASRFVARFIGSPPMSVLPCLVETSGPAQRLQLRIVGMPDETAWPIPDGAPWASLLRHRGDGRIDLGIRAEHLRVRAADSFDPPPLVARGLVDRLEPLGHEVLATLALGPCTLQVRLPARDRVTPGEPLVVALDPAGILWFDPDSGLALRLGG
jgi:ABC-type sugar transport system ATPase subunit